MLGEFPTFKAALDAISGMTEDDLRRDVAALPDEIRETLAQGPLPYRYDCGVCAAFDRDWWDREESYDPDDPMWRAWAYHEVPKIRVAVRAQLYAGPISNETYTRCIATYRAAGWAGEASEPNA